MASHLMSIPLEVQHAIGDHVSLPKSGADEQKQH